MVKFAIISEEEYQVLSKYIDTAGAVLLPEHILKTFSPDVQVKFRAMHEGSRISYDFGGDADVALDIILDQNSYAYSNLIEMNP